jgi:cell division cycle protein 37
MVRWKQAQIHKERREREDQRDLLKMEYEATEKFLEYLPVEIKKIDDLPVTEVIPFLEKLSKDVDQKFTDPMRQESIGRMEKWPGNWEPPVWGDVLRSHVPWNEEINRIAKESVELLKTNADLNLKAVIKEKVEDSLRKFKERQPIIRSEIGRFEDLMNKKLTMDHLQTGFDKTFVAKDAAEKVQSKSAAPAADVSSKKKVEETIFTPGAQKSFFDPEVEQEIFAEMESTDEEMIQRHPKLLELSTTSDYGDMAKLLRQNNSLLTEKNEEALVLRGLCLEIMGKPKEAKNCVTVSLIVKFIRNLGANSVDMFFSKYT